jgi:bifunctional non-homologous end joining protein LigD
MLARSGRLPTGGDFAYEVKWDGFRAIVSAEGPVRVRSRRGWDMTEHVDGEALWEAVCEHGLEGVVAKRRSGRYMSGKGGWIKTKNRECWRYEMEREGAVRSRRPRAFV